MLLPRAGVHARVDREQQLQPVAVLGEPGQVGDDRAAGQVRVDVGGDRGHGVDRRGGAVEHVGDRGALVGGVGGRLLRLRHEVGAVQHGPGQRAQGDVAALQPGEGGPQPGSGVAGALPARVELGALLGPADRAFGSGDLVGHLPGAVQPVVRGRPRPRPRSPSANSREKPAIRSARSPSAAPAGCR